MNREIFRKMCSPLHLLLGGMVLLVGAIEAWYGRPELFGDDISYLDVANMIRAGDWKASLNPLWSIGYPLLLSCIRPWFSSSPYGELTAVFWLNLSIYIATYLIFLGLLHMVSVFIRRDLPDTQNVSLSPFLLVVATCVFVNVQVGFGRVSSVGPDQLVTCLFFLASGLALRFALRPAPGNAALLGATLGLGFIAKAIFLPLSVIVLATAILSRRRQVTVAPVIVAAATTLFFVIPYAAALSWALGRSTLGESGALNYAFHVNQLPHWMGWQGGPGELGAPVHPVQLLRSSPPVFAFGEPFHVTYPPQFNMVYWYDGYRHLFSLKNALWAFLVNLHALEAVLHENAPIVIAVCICACLVLYIQSDRRAWLKQSAQAWPWFMPAILGVVLYLQVHLEGRYIAGFLSVLAIVPFVAMERWGTRVPTRLRVVMLVLLVSGAILNLSTQLRSALRLAIHRTDITSEGQWKIARYLQQMGLQDGDKVAAVSTLNDYRCTWAYAARLHIVADIGNDAYDPQDQEKDLRLFFDDPSTREEVLHLFKQQGAVAVVAPSMPFEIVSPGWQRIPGTSAWVLRL
jgi:hypothetical protein